MSEPRYLSAVAREHLAQAKTRLLNKSIAAGSQEAWTLLFEVAEAASVCMADRAATLHALGYVYAFEAVTSPGGPNDVPDPMGLAALHMETLDGGCEDLRVVDAAHMLANRGTLKGCLPEDSARELLMSPCVAAKGGRGKSYPQ